VEPVKAARNRCKLALLALPIDERTIILASLEEPSEGLAKTSRRAAERA